MNWNLAYPVFEQSGRTPERLALAADGVDLTYADLVRRAGRLAAALREQGLGRSSHVGILGSVAWSRSRRCSGSPGPAPPMCHSA